jgi:hypothetical protein
MSIASAATGLDNTLVPIAMAAMVFIAAFFKSLNTGLLAALLASASITKEINI